MTLGDDEDENESETEAGALANMLDLGESGDEEELSNATEVDELAGILDFSDSGENSNPERPGSEGGDESNETDCPIALEEAEFLPKPGSETTEHQDSKAGDSSNHEDKNEDENENEDNKHPKTEFPVLDTQTNPKTKLKVRKKHRRSLSLTKRDMENLIGPESDSDTPTPLIRKHSRSKSFEPRTTPDFFGLFEDESPEEDQIEDPQTSIPGLSELFKTEDDQESGSELETEPPSLLAQTISPRHSRSKSLLTVPTDCLGFNDFPLSDEGQSPARHARSKTFPPSPKSSHSSGLRTPSPGTPSRERSHSRSSSWLPSVPAVDTAEENVLLNAFAAEASFRLSMSERSQQNNSNEKRSGHKSSMSRGSQRSFTGQGYDHYRRTIDSEPHSYTYDHYGWGSAGVLQFRGKKIPTVSKPCDKFVHTRPRVIIAVGVYASWFYMR